MRRESVKKFIADRLLKDCWFLKMPYNFLLFFGIQVGVAILFPLQIYAVYNNISSYLSIFYVLLIFVLIKVMLVFLYLNFSHIKNIIKHDKYFLSFLVIVFICGLYLVVHEPVISRLDKGFAVLRMSIDSDFITSLADFGVLFRSKAYFLSIAILDIFFQINFKFLANINTVFVMLEAVAIYFILKLLVKKKIIALLCGLVFLFYYNNFYFSLAPDYAILGQVFNVFSLFTLLLYFKTRDINTLIWSLSILLFSVLLRVGSEVWFFIYFVIMYFESRNSKIIISNKLINYFLILSLPCIFPVFLLYASSAFLDESIGNYTNPEMATQIINNGNNFIGLVGYHFDVLLYNFKLNYEYLKNHIPLAWLILFLPFLVWKNKKTWVYFIYFFIFFFVITIFQYNERLDSFHYLSYLIIPLVILFGFLLYEVKNKFIVILLSILLIILNNYFYTSISVEDADIGTTLWNHEYRYAVRNLKQIKPDSVIVSNTGYSIVPTVYGYSDNADYLQAEINIVAQFNDLKQRYTNVYFEQTAMACVRDCVVFNHDEFLKTIKSNFDYEEFFVKDMGYLEKYNNCDIFIYNILDTK